MGQYQQWLHYREVNQQLQSQLEIFERELDQLQHRAQSVSQPEQSPRDVAFSEVHSAEKTALNGSVLAENKIIHALAISLNGHSPEATPASNIEQTHKPRPNTSDESISSALFAGSSLANFENSALPVEANSQLFDPNLGQSLPPISPTPRISHEDITLLPEDMTSFIDEHTLTDPQIELPWWLRNIAAAAHVSQANGPIDQESVRTNRLVQRWLERWGRQPPQPGSHEEHKDE
ncbi:MAG: hypothetical protein M3Y76_04910 [Chloroflexota bacterium]|nr:hypothetical protein [Chloroflexota bacterium]